MASRKPFGYLGFFTISSIVTNLETMGKHQYGTNFLTGYQFGDISLVMKLAEFLELNHLTSADFARTIGVERQAVSRYVNGERFPTREIIIKIHEATGGTVSANDFVDFPPIAPTPAAEDETLCPPDETEPAQ